MKLIGIFIYLLLMLPTILIAQQSDTLEVKKWVPKNLLGFFGTAGMEVVPGFSDYSTLQAFGFGVRYKNLQVKVARRDFNGSVSARVVFPNRFNLDYRFTGVHLNYLRGKNKLRIGPDAYYGIGDIVWILNDTGEIRFRDKINVFRLSLYGEFRLFRYAYAYSGAGYQLISKPQVPRIKDNFNGLFIQLGLSIGYYD